jgi:hypothetical protein
MQQKTCLVLAQYRKDSDYADQVGSRYHFPRKYFNFMALADIEFVYYEPQQYGLGEYFGYGEVGEVTVDPQSADHYYAEIVNYRTFLNPVPGKDDSGKFREAGPSYNPQNAVRKIDPEVFASICAAGGLDLNAIGVEPERTESDEGISNPFDPSKIKVDRESMSVFQVLRKISLNEIILNPDFQRNMVWDPVRRSRLIESALLRIPLPAFYFDGVDANKWVVIDGLQRLSTLGDFITAKNFSLRGLEYLTQIEGATFDKLPRGMQRDLEETPVTLFIIRPETPNEVKFTIFYRINTGGLVLTPQEIRHALFQGQATRLLKTLAESIEFQKTTDGGVSDVRMDARECVLRYLGFHIDSYQNYSKADLNSFLSNTMSQINTFTPRRVEALDADFRESMVRANEILGRVAFRKFGSTTGRRGPINKALFETWSNVLQAYDFDKLKQRKDQICVLLAQRLSEDTDYLRSLSAGTGGVTTVRVRFERAHEVVQEALK